jgi:hypothetical protein
MTQDQFKLLNVINIIKSIDDFDGETMQYILEKVGWDEQMLKQLVSTHPEDAKMILEDIGC